MERNMSDFEEKDDQELTDKTKEETKESQTENNGQKDQDYEDVCFICRRPESKAGKMFKLPNNITVCNDCMHRTMDAVSQFDYQGMLNNPSLMDDLNKNMQGQGFPNIRFVNLTDLQGLIADDVQSIVSPYFGFVYSESLPHGMAAKPLSVY